ncbi:hypothetical protein SAMN06295945_1080 [Polynucleobacter meluiroseus]|uniref:Uncharacterized protein n=1 Tax=Polynucleobacter meluiroseus TaxID=1938814 RepID=A0A240E1E5_9BURK|nr:hypothetical protein [Polynucleobacter meluiroseus]SNX28734.1 hypothetical protein SAMN06295945_1080 [Polynucleobacter meluiroseus]
MFKRYEPEVQRLAELTLENLKLSNRAKAMEKLIAGWREANTLLVVKLKPKLSLKDYKQSINYQPDDSLKLIW